MFYKYYFGISRWKISKNFELNVYFEKAKFTIDKLKGTAVDQYAGTTFNLDPQSLLD